MNKLLLTLVAALILTLVSTAVFAQPCSENETLIRHAMGETCVPRHPERVVVLDTGHLDGALSLGVVPVGSVTAFDDGLFPAYLSKLTEGVQTVGTIAAPDLETILTLKPDLILSAKVRHEAIYDQLSEIAPTVFTETTGVTWKENLELFAKALNREAALEVRTGEYQSRINFIRSLLPVADLEVSVVRFVNGENRVMQRGNFIGTVLDDIGFARPASQASDEFMVTVSQEQIGLMDGDVLFVSYYGDPSTTEMQAFMNSPLWQTLGAVQNNAVYQVSDDHWFLGIGFLGANRIMDDLLVLLDHGPTSDGNSER
jgi:iron complex transport system substrate-binding protein